MRIEDIEPLPLASFDQAAKAHERNQGGHPRRQGDVLVFDGAQDGDRQVDPQIAVGGDRVVHLTNKGLIVYDKDGTYRRGGTPAVFHDGIDPKVFFDVHARVFAFDLWQYWDKAKHKPVHVSVSATADPLGAWHTYAVPAPDGKDGGGLGHSRTWLGYSFPGGAEQTFVLRLAEAVAGKRTTVWHFAGNLGQPVNTIDPLDDLWFVALTDRDLVLTRVHADGDAAPAVVERVQKPHGFAHFDWPPPSPQKGTEQKTASGDRNPKALVVAGGCLWFAHNVAIDGRAAVQWHQFKLDGTRVQGGTLAHATNSYIQVTLAVNRQQDVLVGFQETGPDLPISPRCAWRRHDDPPGTLQPIVALGEGQGATDGQSWGDYSSTVVDGDDLTTLWTVQSVTDAKGKGDTVIARVPFAPRKKD